MLSLPAAPRAWGDTASLSLVLFTPNILRISCLGMLVGLIDLSSL